MDWTKTIAWFIIILMVLSGVGFLGAGVFSNPSGSYEEEYNGFTLSQQSSYWVLTQGSYQYPFLNFPTDLEDLSISLEVGKWRQAGVVYLAYLPNDTVDVLPYQQQLGNVFTTNGLRQQQSCIKEEGCPDVPIIDCSINSGLIYQSGKEVEIIQDQNCLVVSAPTAFEFQRITERIIYGFLGVMT
ncbi:hypothetical protein HOC32_05345 [Candidatus Woesearchaeota archaeon]|jgi:hypothetical protein|nr:hypothetical protein [Candidatus Woesearchaeota archaeon]